MTFAKVLNLTYLVYHFIKISLVFRPYNIIYVQRPRVKFYHTVVFEIVYSFYLAEFASLA